MLCNRSFSSTIRAMRFEKENYGIVVVVVVEEEGNAEAKCGK